MPNCPGTPRDPPSNCPGTPTERASAENHEWHGSCSALRFETVPKAPLTPANPRIEDLILLVRGHRVLLDVHLAGLYGVDVRVLNQAVRRNIERFPEDFMFQLTADEQRSLRSQFVISNSRGGRRYLAFVFTEQGVAMLSSVLRSPQAVQANVAIMRTFVKLRRLLHSNEELSRKLDALEQRYDAQFRAVFQAIRKLMLPPPTDTRRRIGFRSD